MITELITAESIPDYDNWGPDSYWSSQEWITWHQALIKKHGLNKANRILVDAFLNPLDGSNPFLQSHIDFRTTDQGFKNYAKEHGFYQGLFNGISGIITKPVSVGLTITDTATNAAEEIAEDVAESATNITGVGSWLIPLVVVVLVVLILINIKHIIPIIKPV